MAKFKVGDKIQYQDSKGNWLPGVIHATRNTELPDGEGGVKVVDETYLVDTGNDVTVQIYPTDVNGQKLASIFDEKAAKVVDPTKRLKLFDQVVKDNSKLATAKVETIKERQPEQVEVTAAQLKPRR